MKKIFGTIKKHKVLTAICLIVAVVLVISILRPAGSVQKYNEEIAQKRDIVTYNNFVGNVGFTTEMNALSKASAEVLEVYFEIGDSVSKGDLIATLDSKSLEENIEKAEISIKNQEKANEHTLADAQRAYDNFKYALDNGLNSSLNSVQTQKTNAEKSLNTIKDSYDDYMETLCELVDAGALSDASTLVLTFRNYETALDQYETYKESVDSLKAAIEADPNATDADKAKLETYLKTLASYKADADSKLVVYEEASENYGNIHDKNFKTLIDNIESAETAYTTACEAYDSVKLQLDQQLASYEATLNKAKDTLSLESANKELEILKENLKNYKITAPCDGIITSLNIDAGDMAGAGVAVATVSNLGELEISIKIDEYSILNSKVGKDVLIYIDSIGKTYEGKITWIANNATVTQGVSYFESTVEFNADEYVRGGMSVEVKLVREESKGAVSVSVDAINYRDNNTAYLLVEDGHGNMVERDVSLGISDGLFVEIVEGISEGDKIFYVPKAVLPFPVM